MDWRMKAVVQGVLSRVPGGTMVNDQLQRIAGGRRDGGAHVDAKVEADWLVHQTILRDLRFRIQDRVVLEIGTGWLPVFPLCYALAGARRCYTYDLNRHLHFASIRRTLVRLERHLGAIAGATAEAESVVKARWQRLMQAGEGEQLLAAAGIEYRAPFDACATALPDASVALVFSNSVLEHVSPRVLVPLMHESGRVLETDGLSLHSVNCGDHYAYFDRSITPIHYLRFSDRQWRWWNNDLLYQNRLRPSDLVAAAREARMEIVLDLHVPRPDLMSRLAELPIAAEFRRYPPEDLCSTSVTFAARPPHKGPAVFASAAAQ